MIYFVGLQRLIESVIVLTVRLTCIQVDKLIKDRKQLLYHIIRLDIIDFDHFFIDIRLMFECLRTDRRWLRLLFCTDINRFGTMNSCSHCLYHNNYIHYILQNSHIDDVYKVRKEFGLTVHKADWDSHMSGSESSNQIFVYHN